MGIISREAAKQQGLRLFFTGDACPNGHMASRYVKSGGCQQCALDRCAANRVHARALAKQHYAANKAEILEKKRRYYEANTETVKARSRAYRESLPSKPRMYGPRISMIGQVFGKLTVLRQATQAERGKVGDTCWVCACECGATDVVREGHGLRKTKARGGVSSCGCTPRNQHRTAPAVRAEAGSEI